MRRGYPNKLIENAIIKAFRKNRSELLTEIPTKNQHDVDNKLFVITTYQPEFTGLKDTILKDWNFLTRSNNTKPLHDNKIIFGYRRSKNLGIS